VNGIARLMASWRARVALTGHSMSPTLRDGDWVLVDPDAYRLRSPTPGELVVADSSAGPVVKRVAERLDPTSLLLAGDAPSGGGHRHEVVLAVSTVSGRPWFRYWPPGRIGRVR